MSDRFVVKPKQTDKKGDRYVVTTIRIEKDLLEAFGDLAAKSDRSRNDLICTALQCALDHLEFVPAEES